MAFDQETLRELVLRATKDPSLAKTLREDAERLTAKGWVRLKNGSFIKATALSDPRTVAKNTFYFAAYREFTEDPGLRNRILEFMEPARKAPQR
jgi:hypothetical protein